MEPLLDRLSYIGSHKRSYLFRSDSGGRTDKNSDIFAWFCQLNTCVVVTFFLTNSWPWQIPYSSCHLSNPCTTLLKSQICEKIDPISDRLSYIGSHKHSCLFCSGSGGRSHKNSDTMVWFCRINTCVCGDFFPSFQLALADTL